MNDIKIQWGINFRYFPYCISVLIQISAPELHVWDVYLWHEVNNMERYVKPTYRFYEIKCIEWYY